MPVDPFVARVQEIVCAGGSPPVVPVGARTKNGLIPSAWFQTGSAQEIDIREHSGIVTYDPSEFLISAKAGTNISEIHGALATHGQFLPFDPLFAADGATLGGTIASGISGPDRLLYGTARDFVMEVALIDGLGKFVRGGGKVVKNAAGFDTPKMMVGSYGRLGILLEITLKVLPAPQAEAAIEFHCETIEQALLLSQSILAKPYPIAGLDINPQNRVVIRVAGPAASLPKAVERIRSYRIENNALTSTNQDRDDHHISPEQWLESPPDPNNPCLVRIAVSPNELLALHRHLTQNGYGNFLHCGAASVTWVNLPTARIDELGEALRALTLSAIVVRGEGTPSFLGDKRWLSMSSRIQRAMDPNQRFVPFSS